MNTRMKINEILNENLDEMSTLQRWSDHAKEYFNGNLYDMIEQAVEFWIDNNNTDLLGNLIKTIHSDVQLIKETLIIQKLQEKPDK